MNVGKKMDREKKQEIVIALLMITIIPLFHIIFIYSRNVEVASIGDFAPSVLLYFCIALVLTVTIFVFLKSLYKSALLVCSFSLVFTNYKHLEDLIQGVLPVIRYWHLAPVVIVLYLHLAYLILKKLSVERCKYFCSIILVPFCLLTLLNIAISVPKMLNNNQSVSTDMPMATMQEHLHNVTDSELDLPNIYLFIFDEYSGFEAIQHVFDYNNIEFERFLLDSNFSVSRNSQNHSWWTAIIMHDLLNLNYVGEPHSTETHQPFLYRLLESYGYELRGVGHSDSFYLPSESGVANETIRQIRTIEGDNVLTVLLKSSMIYPLVKSDTSTSRAEEVLDAFSYINNIENVPHKPTFTLFYVLSPHAPFIFDEYGNILNTRGNYLQQFKFITKLITETVGFLIEEDPDSVIILQSDHAQRSYSGENYVFYITNILNAVYYRGETIQEIDGQSGINTLRLVLNKLLGTGFALLEDPRND